MASNKFISHNTYLLGTSKTGSEKYTKQYSTSQPHTQKQQFQH